MDFTVAISSREDGVGNQVNSAIARAYFDGLGGP